MVENIKRKFPRWCEESGENYELILSDDIDSFMCYVFQKNMFNRDISHFFNANNTSKTQKLYVREGYNNSVENLIALDCAFEHNMKCWDNHITKIRDDDSCNMNSANLNNVMNIYRDNFKYKACISSFITMLSYYNVDISKWTKEQLAVLCCIDGLYHPFKSDNNFEAIGRRNLDKLEYRFLESFIVENIDYILKIKNQLRLDEKILIKDGKLATNIDLESLKNIYQDIFQHIELPDTLFTEKAILHKEYITISDYSSISKNSLMKEKNVINFVMTFKKRCIVSYY